MVDEEVFDRIYDAWIEEIKKNIKLRSELYESRKAYRELEKKYQRTNEYVTDLEHQG